MPGKTGVLALQGSFSLHERALERLGAPHQNVKTADDLAACDRLILPGGESTVISKLLVESGLADAIRARFLAGTLALFGTCAGAILLGREPAPAPGEPPPGTALQERGRRRPPPRRPRAWRRP